jgi:hypothetical protein
MLAADLTLRNALVCQRWGLAVSLGVRDRGLNASGLEELPAFRYQPWEVGCYRAGLLTTLNYGIHLDNM